MARTTSDCTNLQHCTSLTPLSSLTHLLCRGCNTAHNRHNRMFSCHFRIHLQCIDTQQCNTQFSVWCRARSPHPVRLRSLTHLNWARGRKVQFRWESARVFEKQKLSANWKQLVCFSTYCTLHDSYQMKVCGASYSEPRERDGGREREGGGLEWLSGCRSLGAHFQLCHDQWSNHWTCTVRLAVTVPGTGSIFLQDDSRWRESLTERTEKWRDCLRSDSVESVHPEDLFIWADCLRTKHVTVTTYKCSSGRNKWGNAEYHLCVIIKTKSFF